MRNNTKFIYQKYRISSPQIIFIEPARIYKNRDEILKEEIEYFYKHFNANNFIILNDNKSITCFRIIGPECIVDFIIFWDVK